MASGRPLLHKMKNWERGHSFCNLFFKFLAVKPKTVRFAFEQTVPPEIDP